VVKKIGNYYVVFDGKEIVGQYKTKAEAEKHAYSLVIGKRYGK
jgi:hypothetical protein